MPASLMTAGATLQPALGLDPRDDLDRLLAATNTGDPSLSQTFSYDRAHNLTSNSAVGTYSYPAKGLGAIRPHAATSAGPFALTAACPGLDPGTPPAT